MHTMTHIETVDGRERWHCPQCGYQFWLTWTPYTKRIVYPGDPYAGHTGGRGGLTMSAPILDATDVDGPDVTAWALPSDAAATLLRRVFEDEADGPSEPPFRWLEDLRW